MAKIHGLPRDRRIRKGREFERFRLGGVRCAHCGVFVLKSIDSTAIGADESGLPARIGIITPKKIGNAVWRNTIRRVIREAFRLNSQVFQRNRDYLVVAMRGITEKSNAEISEKIVNAATKMR